MKKIIGLFLCIISLISSCERDDICAAETPTTPRLIIDFLNFSDLVSAKDVSLLAVIGVDNDVILEDYSAVTSSQVILPLKTNENSTEFILYKNAEVDDDGTISAPQKDIITITYTLEEIFVSRACGYKIIFKNVSVQFESDTDSWIQLIQPLNDNQSIEDETTTHFNIFH